ncbi:MAG TPA: DUF4982 domain-containing protein, partial [Verrucomicrobiae bacterium]
RGWYRGVLELTDFYKPQTYYIQSFYSRQPMVHLAVFNTADKTSQVWNDVSLDWQKMYDSWNFTAGESVQVAAFSNAEAVELFLNGQSLGMKFMADCPRQKMVWSLPFAAGELKAIARRDGRIVAEHVLRTAGPPRRVHLAADRETLQADGQDLAFIRFTVEDNQGNLCPVNAPAVRFLVSGSGVNTGVASGDMSSLESYQGDTRKPYQGAGLLVVRATRQPGMITVKAVADGLESATLELPAR